MWNEPTKERLGGLPVLYETEHVPIKKKLVHLHFFIGGCDWYICETDGDVMWGFCILNNDYEMAEWGYFSLPELVSIKSSFMEVDRDLHFPETQAQNIPVICKAQRWQAKEVMTKQ